ncbi:hypothetical protein C8J56DRAFT_796161 [Mycena floridula]|nr:hypothetical protein C8J56DRAFT_796161 [Mycena floridula]
MAPPIPSFIHQQFPDFVYEPERTILDNFRRLALIRKWGKKSEQYKRQKRDFLGNAVEAMFSTSFGEIRENLEAWCNLCRTVGVSTDLPLVSIEACEAALNGKFVNLVDLVQAASADQVMEKTFPTSKALAKYIHRTGKFYPLDRAKVNPLLAQFLIIVGKRRKKKGGRRGKKGGRGKKAKEEKK